MAPEQNIGNIIANLVERLKYTYQPERIILYGSYAYGKPDSESDIDLLIIKEPDERPVDRRITVRRLVADLRRKIPFSSLVVTPKEISDLKTKTPKDLLFIFSSHWKNISGLSDWKGMET